MEKANNVMITLNKRKAARIIGWLLIGAFAIGYVLGATFRWF